MDSALIIGHNSPLTGPIAKKLIDAGYRTLALAPNFKQFPFAHKLFHSLECDLQDTPALESTLDSILKDHPNIAALVFLDAFNHPEDLSLNSLESHLHTNLVNFPIATRILTPSLIRSHASITLISQLNPTHPITAAQSQGLHAFLQSIFNQTRNCGLSYTRILLDGQTFAQKSNSQSSLNPEFVADAFQATQNTRNTNIISELTLSPQSTSEDNPLLQSPTRKTPSLADITLPHPEDHPKEPEIFRALEIKDTPKPKKKTAQKKKTPAKKAPARKPAPKKTAEPKPAKKPPTTRNTKPRTPTKKPKAEDSPKISQPAPKKKALPRGRRKPSS